MQIKKQSKHFFFQMERETAMESDIFDFVWLTREEPCVLPPSFFETVDPTLSTPEKEAPVDQFLSLVECRETLAEDTDSEMSQATAPESSPSPAPAPEPVVVIQQPQPVVIRIADPLRQSKRMHERPARRLKAIVCHREVFVQALTAAKQKKAHTHNQSQ